MSFYSKSCWRPLQPVKDPYKQVHTCISPSFTFTLISPYWNSGTGQTSPSSSAPALTGVHLGGD